MLKDAAYCSFAASNSTLAGIVAKIQTIIEWTWLSRFHQGSLGFYKLQSSPYKSYLELPYLSLVTVATPGWRHKPLYEAIAELTNWVATQSIAVAERTALGVLSTPIKTSDDGNHTLMCSRALLA